MPLGCELFTVLQIINAKAIVFGLFTMSLGSSMTTRVCLCVCLCERDRDGDFMLMY